MGVKTRRVGSGEGGGAEQCGDVAGVGVPVGSPASEGHSWCMCILYGIGGSAHE